MTLGNKIAELRKQNNLTQDALAQELGVSNQAVSKWESDQCCPDISLLPKLADLFGISIDTLFGREPAAAAAPKTELPWPDDNTLHVVLFAGHKLVGDGQTAKEITFTYEGPALNIDSAFAVNCDDVGGSVTAGAGVYCDDVGGSVTAAAEVNCGDVGESVTAGAEVNCGDVGSNLRAEGDVNCGDVGGHLAAEGDVSCGDVGGNLTAGGDVNCGDVEGSISAGGDVNCGAFSDTENADGYFYTTASDGAKVRIILHTDHPEDTEKTQKVQERAEKITEDTRNYLSKVFEKMRSQWGDEKKDPDPPAES